MQDDTMSRKVQVISRETIKPSSSTPHHLRSLKLSLLDQFIPQLYVPIILYYPTNGSFSGGEIENAERSNRLKKSLSETLTRFYPLAGRIKDNLWIDCNDQGVEYSETRVNCHLAEVLKRPEVELLNQLLPFRYQSSDPSAGDLQLAVRINIFDCGGMAIGMRISHKLADASSISIFLNGWAATAREASEDIICPRFDSASLFPPIDFAGFQLNVGVATEKIVTKRFTIDATKIAALRAKIADSSSAIQPTRVEAVSALVWKCFIAVGGVELKSSGQFVASHAVNLRGRMVPPVPEHCFGNMLQLAIVPLEVEKGTELGSLVSQLRDGIRKIDGDYISKLQSDNGISMFDYINEVRELLAKGEVQFCKFSSWCRFPFYEADFGWGKPVWMSIASGKYKNNVFLMDTRWGDGIEIWVTMEDQDMAKFESDPELLAFVSST